MKTTRILTHRIVSAEGQEIAIATAVTTANTHDGVKTYQSTTLEVTSGSGFSSCSGSASASASS
ncbi:MAG TPA: hypothetical protein V6C57_19115 [Coleofasciculaceae cyanobacterium]